MNKTIEAFARQTIKEGLTTCTEGQQFRFKRVYSGGQLSLDLDAIVDAMPVSDLDKALTQVENTLGGTLGR